MTRRPGTDSERGSVLILFPAAVLVVFLLGALAVDSASLYLHQREAQNLAFDAANDAAGAGMDLDAARAGALVLDPAVVAAVADATIAASAVDVSAIDVRIEGNTVIVALATTVEPLLGRPFGLQDRTVTVTARATGVVAPG